MPNQLEKLIKVVYKKWKSKHLTRDQMHPNEETWACFLEGRLTPEENELIKTHLITCEVCAEVFATQLKLRPQAVKGLPKELVQAVKNLVVSEARPSLLEIVLLLKEKALEILNTTGDVLVGQEIVPEQLFRSRQKKEFRDEVTILKDFKDIRVEVKIENKLGGAFDLIIFVKDKQTQHIIKDLRVTLLEDDLELESYLTTSDKLIFEHVLAGKYILEIANLENKIASILLDIRK